MKFFRKKFFRLSVRSKPSLCSVFQLYRRFSLESGCKITALQHIYQILQPLFYKLFASFTLSRWFSKHAEEHKIQGLFRGRRNYTLLLYIIGENKTENLLQELQTAWYWTYFLWSSVVNTLSNCNCYPSCLQPPGFHLMILPAVRRRNFIRELHAYQPDIQ